MTSQDARVVLALGEGPVDRDEIRRSYLARVRDVRVSTDPEGFIRLRESYELLGHPGRAALDEVQAARDALAAQPDAAEALTIVKESRSTCVAMAGGDDLQTAAAFQIAEDLARLGVSLPLDLRQAAALTAKRGDFENAPYAARFATRMMSSRAIRQLSRRLAQDAPTLAKVLRFDLTDDQLCPAGTPAFRLSGGWAGAIVAVFLQLCWVVHKLEQPELQLTSEETIPNVRDALLDVMVQECKAPWSEACLRWNDAARPLANNGHPTPDPGLDPPMIGNGLPR